MKVHALNFKALNTPPYGFQVMHEHLSKHAPFSSVQEQIASDPEHTECPFLPFADQ